MNHAAIYSLYPQVVMIDDGTGAFDAQGQAVYVDPALVAVEERRLAEQAVVDARIAELKQLLNDSDYKVSPDYDKPDEGVKVQRQAWREEIRNLETQA